MTTPSPIKILAVGAAKGAIANLFSKVKTMNAKHGPFALLLCVGDFFGPLDQVESNEDIGQLLLGKLEVPMTTYIMQGDCPLPRSIVNKVASTGGQICSNVLVVGEASQLANRAVRSVNVVTLAGTGKTNVLRTSQGLRIAWLGGVYDKAIYDNPHSEGDAPLSPTYLTSEEVTDFLAKPVPSGQHVPFNTDESTSKSEDHVDILLTHEWPVGITQHCTTTLPSLEAANWGAPPLQAAVMKLKPRYHFASGGGNPPLFWERQPFVWEGHNGRVARFVNLGAFGAPGPEPGQKKERWFYAFSIAPEGIAGVSQPRPPNATASPFGGYAPQKRTLDTDSGDNYLWGNQAKKSRRDEGGRPPAGYVCKICQSTEHFIKECPQRSEKKRVPDGYTCKICDSTEHLIKDCPRRDDAEHKAPEGYICKICDKPGHFLRHCPDKVTFGDSGGKKPPPGYVCRACASEGHFIKDCPSAAARPPRGERSNQTKEIAPKGQLPPTGASNSPGIPGGGHVLIIPISHYPTLQAVPVEFAIPVISEIERFKSALRDVYAKYGCVAVALEVARLSGKGGHAHVQVIPVPEALAGRVEQQFIDDGKGAGLGWEADADAALEHAAKANENYFKVDLPDGRKMVHVMRPGQPFSLQFGRTTVANLLGLKERIDWKACNQTEAEEKVDATAFKNAFAPFDSTA
ncbi:hypothetical protein FRB96_003430 [Tulasnella sp. 330]|nr:hypothetical protein FRB96_003430 [Tulasnella sp. 330]KAG8882758.1 hypothetical protein FRB97_007797 [Tulasnella sp. 331]